MAQRRFTLAGIRRQDGRVASGDTVKLYLVGGVAAHISATDGGAAISGSTVTLDSKGGALFYGPTDNADTLELEFTGNTAFGKQKVYADTDPRLDDLEAASGGGGTGTSTEHTWTAHQYFTSGRPHVDVRGFATIAAAIAAAPTGAQINLGPGTLPSSMVPTVCTLRTRTKIKGDGKAATIVTGTAGQNVFQMPELGTHIELEDFTIVGGAKQIVSTPIDYVSHVSLTDMILDSPSAECIDLTAHNEEWHLLRVATNGGTYGLRVRNTGANPLFDRSSFIACRFNGASEHAVSIQTAISNTVLFVLSSFIISGKHNVTLDGGIRQMEFLGCNTEGAGQGTTSNRTTLSGSVASGATSGTLASSTGWATSGSAVTIRGAGAGGVDHQGGAWTRSGTTLTWTTVTATTISGPNVTDALYDDYCVTNAIASPSNIVWRSVRCGFEGQGGHLRYAISIPATGLHRADNCSNDGNIPVYDPGSRMRVTGGELTVRRPSGVYSAGEDLYAPVIAPVITGSRGGNAALQSLLAALAARGFIVDNSS